MRVVRIALVGLLVSAVLTSCSCGGGRRGGGGGMRTGDLTVTGLGLTGQNVAPGTQDAPILWFQMQTNQAIVVVESITFKASGTGDDAAHVDLVELWLDGNSNGVVDMGTDQLLGSGTYSADDGTVTINCNKMIFSNTTESWLLSYDFNANATGTFQASIENVETDVKATVGGKPTRPSGGTITGPTITISIGDLTVTVGPNPPSNSAVTPGATDVPIMQFTLSTGSEDVEIISVKIKASGTGDDAADISAVHLYHDANENGLHDSGETEIASGTYSTDDGELTFTCNRTISANSSETWLVTYDFNASADGTFTASIEDITTDIVAQTTGGTSITPGGTNPINGATITVTPAELTVEAGPNMPSNQTIPSGQTNVPVLQVKLSVPSGASSDITVISITFTASGSGDDLNHIDAVKLYLDANENGQLDAGETQIDTNKQYSADNGTVTFNVNRTISAGSYEVYLLVYDFNSSADGTFKASIADIQTDVVAQDAGGNSVAPAGTSPLDGATITVSSHGPVVLAAELREDPSTTNGTGDAGETIIVTFDKDVVVNNDDPSQVFKLPVSDDDFGSGATLTAGPNSNQVTITLGSGCVITGTGVFDSTHTSSGDPSGIDISDTMPDDAIEDAAGLDAEPTDPVDIACPYTPGQTVTGFSINVLDPMGQQWGNVIIQYIVADSTGATLDVTVEYYDGTQWKPATSASGSDPLTGFTASEKGDLRVFVWDSYTDMPNAGEATDYDKVMLRFTLTDGTDSEQDTAEVMLDNKPQVICGPDQVVNVGEDVIVDAGRSVDPADPSGTLNYTFTLTSQPSGSAATLTTVDYLTSFTADAAGDYEIEVRVEAGGRQSDPVTVKITAVESSNVTGKLHLGNLNGSMMGDAQPYEISLCPGQNIGYYTAYTTDGTYENRKVCFLDLSATPIPAIPDPPCKPDQPRYAYSFTYQQLYTFAVFPTDVYVNRNSNTMLAAYSDLGTLQRAGYMGSCVGMFIWDATQGAADPVGALGWVSDTTGWRSYGLSSFVRTWEYVDPQTGTSGGQNTNDVGYIATNAFLLEVGSQNTAAGSTDPALLSYTDQAQHAGPRVSCETTDHGNGLNAWVCIHDTAQSEVGVGIFNIDTVGNGDGYNQGLNAITSITWASDWTDGDLPEDIWVDNANGKVWVLFTRSGENGGVCVIDCASQEVELRYQIPLATNDATPLRLLALQSENILLATDYDHDRVFVLRVDDWASPSSVGLDYTISISKPYDLDYDDPRDRVLVTSPDNSDIYVLEGPWSPDVKVVSGGAAQITSYAVAHHPRNAEIYLVYCEDTSAIKFTKSTDGGRTWSDPVELSKQPFTYVSNPDIAVDRVGNIIVVWQSDGGIPADGIYLTRSSDGGQTWEDPVRCEPDGAPGTTKRTDPAVTVDDACNIIITYIADDGSNVQAAIMKSVGGQSWLYWGADADNTVSTATDCSAPDVVVVPDANEPLGKIVATWHQGATTSAFYSYTVANSGWHPTGGTEAKVNQTSGNAVEGSVYVNGSLEARFCWSDDTNATPNYDVYFGDGSGDVVIDDSSGTSRYGVRLAFVDNVEDVYAAYIVDDKYIYWATSDDAGATWGTIQQLLFTDATRSHVWPITNRTGTRMLFWLEENASGGTDIMFTRFR